MYILLKYVDLSATHQNIKTACTLFEKPKVFHHKNNLSFKHIYIIHIFHTNYIFFVDSANSFNSKGIKQLISKKHCITLD